MRFTKIAEDTFQHLTINAGILLSAFEPSTFAYQESNLLGATTGGMTFAATPEFVDFGEDIDNCPKNTKELKRIKSQTASISGTFVAMNEALCAKLCAAADNTAGHIVPRDTLKDSDFSDLWLVADYSEYNGETKGGGVAIHLMNALNTAGLQLVTADDEKGKFAFTFTAHYSIEEQATVPFEIYIKSGTAES